MGFAKPQHNFRFGDASFNQFVRNAIFSTIPLNPDFAINHFDMD